MTQARSHAELVTLRKLAQDIATSRKERMTSVHLIAAVARSEGAAGELLRERRLDDEVLLKASRAFDDDGPDPVGRLFAAARQVAMRRLWYGNEPSPPPASAGRASSARPSATPSSSPEPTALHLLLALLSDRSAAAHRSLVHAGVDLARLRTAAMQVALGVIAPRRIPSSAARTARPEPEPARRRHLRALALALAHPLARAVVAAAAQGRARRHRPDHAAVPFAVAAPRAPCASPRRRPHPSRRPRRHRRRGRRSRPRASPSTGPASRRSPRSATTSRWPPPRGGSRRSSAARRRSSAPSTSSPSATPAAPA